MEVGGGPNRPGGGTSDERSSAGTSLVLSGSDPAPAVSLPPGEPRDSRVPLPTGVRTVDACCLNTDGIDSRMAWFVERSQYEYSALPTLAAALTTPAPMTVPATPKNEASTAAVIEARAPARTWTGLRWMERSRSFMRTPGCGPPGCQPCIASANYIYRRSAVLGKSDRSSVTPCHLVAALPRQRLAAPLAEEPRPPRGQTPFYGSVCQSMSRPPPRRVPRRTVHRTTASS
jgi:hypothetical protein